MGLPPFPRQIILRAGRRTIALGERTLVMGILNVTPDSFSGDGVTGDVEAILARARRLVAEGADILDVGGESTRPGARPVPEDEEIARVVPSIAAVAGALDVPISVDTRKPAVAAAALAAGADLVNDVTGLRRNPDLADVVAARGGAIVLMHSPGESWAVRWPAHYEDVVAQVRDELAASVEVARRAGIGDDQIVLDPGFGFGKSPADNLTLLRRLGEFRSLGYPTLLGTSRKSTLGKILNLPVEDRLEASLATLPLAVAQGVDVVRVHDVLASVRVVRVADAVVRGVGALGGAPR